MTLGELRLMLRRAFRVLLDFGVEDAERQVNISGFYSIDELARLIEQQTECEAVVTGRRISLVCSGDSFRMVVPGIVGDGSSVAGVVIRNLSGRYVAEGKRSELPAFRRVLSELESPRVSGRLRVFVMDDKKGSELAVRFGSPFQIGFSDGLISSWASDVFITGAVESGAVVREFEALMVEGSPVEYDDV